jgi:dihydroorotase
MAQLLIKNGRVIDPAAGLDGPADVLVEGGRLAAVGGSIPLNGVESFDAEGMIVAPGFIDMHVHLREPTARRPPPPPPPAASPPSAPCRTRCR